MGKMFGRTGNMKCRKRFFNGWHRVYNFRTSISDRALLNCSAAVIDHTIIGFIMLYSA